MSDVTIYHNPRCSTSRNVLALIRETGTEPDIVKYLETPPDRNTLTALLAAASLSPRDAIRKREKLYKELGLDGPGVTDDQLLDAMLEHPILIERPLVATPKGVRLARPAHTVTEIL
ncbi:arsenate reductase (glutaredoxin) [Hoyosella sp. YIM 151337]|uniref:arsenate reductase (glutaredoxin) n=1 Tax=Hoyosella sp. YIM 151337 TaxID=2992742 RepID=UPI002236859D|nr:arsenate reductase (glutaredoxin) [Hoyosella sp. YIM 151337]MCW4352034.1 arsenate reductase (glutaredoxin) [Hoyosella sp. YIM 151337]